MKRGNVIKEEAITLQRKDQNMNQAPQLAPGIDDDEELNEEATKQEIKQGDSTRVFTFSYDEVNPS